MDYIKLKQRIFDRFNSELANSYQQIQKSGLKKQQKTSQMQKEIDVVFAEISQEIRQLVSNEHLSTALILAQYCFTVISLEYRHALWPYEYMAFSRRIGELWERFCKSAWDYSNKVGLERVKAPNFNEVKSSFINQISDIISNDDERAQTLEQVSKIFELVGEINMEADEMFRIHEDVYIIDFKSGFGSNEKGNTLRLLAVGLAYNFWNPDSNLLFLVRQNENNNYLERIRRSALWEVHCGQAAYTKIDELTDSGIDDIRNHFVDFESDLSDNFWQFLIENNLADYLNW